MTDIVKSASEQVFGFQPYPSYYNVFNHLLKTNILSPIAKQHFVETFSGQLINPEIWTQIDQTGTGSNAMADEIDEGHAVISGANDDDRTLMDFNDIRHYEETGCVLEAVIRRTETASEASVGFKNTTSLYGSLRQYVSYQDNSEFTKKRWGSGSSNGASFTLSSIDEDTTWTRVKFILAPSVGEMFINGSLEVTKTSILPSVPLQPFYRSQTLTAATKECRLRYLEVYNT